MIKYNYYKPEDVIAALRSGSSILENECTKFLISTYYSKFLNTLTRKGFRFRDDQKKSLWYDTIMTFKKKVLVDKYTVQEKTKLSTYLIRIGIYHALNERRRKVDVVKEIDVDIPLKEEEASIDVELLDKFLQNLSERCRTILTLSYFKDIKQSEIAIELNSTEESIKVQKHNCLKKLFALMKENKYELLDFF